MGLVRSRWAAIGAAVAITLGAGGLVSVSADSAESVFVGVTPRRVLDTREVVFGGPLLNSEPQQLNVTGPVPVVDGGISSMTVVPEGATAIVANVTAVAPTTIGYVAVRPGTAVGVPATSNINITTPGSIVPNSVTVELAPDGTIDLFFFGTAPGATTDLLVDIVGYYTEGGAGVPGPRGKTGPQGETGPQGLAAWDTIPSGLTVSGDMIYDRSVIADTEDGRIYIPFPAIAPSPVADNSHVNVAPSAEYAAEINDADPTCTGSVSAPTAPAGRVCVYVMSLEGMDRVSGVSSFIRSERGFYVSFRESGILGDDLYLNFSWAYTAP